MTAGDVDLSGQGAATAGVARDGHPTRAARRGAARGAGVRLPKPSFTSNEPDAGAKDTKGGNAGGAVSGEEIIGEE